MTQETSCFDVESCRSWHGSWQLVWLTIGFRITLHLWCDAFFGSAISLKTHLLGTLVKHLCPHFLFWRWSRSRHKRIRGIGSQAASRRGAKSRRLALAFKARSFSGPTLVSHWKMCFRFLSVRDRMPRQRSAVWQTTCVVLAFAVACLAVWGALPPFQPWCVVGTLRDNIEAATEVLISLWSSPFVVSLSQFPQTIAAPFPSLVFWPG